MKSEEGIRVGVGEFRVDKEAMSRILARERKGVWKHRAGVLWKHFGCSVGAVLMMILIPMVLYAQAQMVRLAFGDGEDFFRVICGFGLFVLLFGFDGFLFAFHEELLQMWRSKVEAVRSEWNPPTVYGKEDA